MNNADLFQVVPQRRRSSASSNASPVAHTMSDTYTQHDIYTFLLVSKELQAAADFVAQLLDLGGLRDEILLSEFKTILVDLMAERFSEVWDVLQPRRGAGFRTITHAPQTIYMPNADISKDSTNNSSVMGKKNRSLSLSAVNAGPTSMLLHTDPILQTAFVFCNIHPRYMSTLLPVSFSLTINPGLVAYTTTDVDGFHPVHLFEARPYLPPRHQEPVDHGAEARMRALKSIQMGQVDIKSFDIDGYFGGGHRSKEE